MHGYNSGRHRICGRALLVGPLENNDLRHRIEQHNTDYHTDSYCMLVMKQGGDIPKSSCLAISSVDRGSRSFVMARCSKSPSWRPWLNLLSFPWSERCRNQGRSRSDGLIMRLKSAMSWRAYSAQV